MKDIDEEPTDQQQEEFKKLEKFGEASVEEFSGLQERLGESEEIKMLSTAKLKKGHRSVLCLTDERLILFNSEKAKLLGTRGRFEDIRLEDIKDIEVEERKGFDLLRIETKEGQKKLSLPKKKGMEISGLIRGEQSRKEDDPAEKLEKLGKEKERGNISEEEYDNKKEDLMDRI